MHIAQLISEYDNLMKYKKIEIHLEDESIPLLIFLFKTDHFKHLLGFHYTKNFRYLASDEVYKLCKNGQISLGNDKKIKNYSKKSGTFIELTGPGFNKLIEKIMNYKMVHTMLCDPNNKSLVDFDKTIVVGETNQGSDYILHFEKDNVRFHLGLKKDENTDIYAPSSFFFEKDIKKDKFITGQKHIKIKKISRIH